MATYTPNLNLYKPDASDDFGSFRQEFNDNMDKLDNGGGGGSGGHTIVDENGSDMPAESKLQFTGNVSVTDDNVNGKTIVDILGGGGNVYGAFIDTDNVISTTIYRSSMSYLATQDCYVAFYIVLGAGATYLDIDGEHISTFYDTNIVGDTTGVYLKKGQTVSVSNANANIDGNYVVYGITQGTNGIYAPVIYSDNERVIGVWRDNKPLYQKTFVKNSTDTSGAGVSFDVSALDIDTCVDVFGTCDRIVTGVGTLIYPFNSYEDASLRTYVAYSKFNTCINFNIRFYVGESTSTQYITILYTKNSDVAGSGDWNTDGVPTVHYSTSEQVIGTWINSKPLYQKTVTFTAQSGGYQNVALGVSNADMMYISEAYIISNIETAVLSSYTGNVGNEEFQGLIAGLTTFDYRCGSDLNGGAGMVTVRYTKSTD